MGRAGWRRRKRVLLMVAALLAGALGVLTYATHLFNRTELQSIDARFSVRGAQRAPSDIEVVQIDNATLRELRSHHLASEFPFPRRYEARVIDHLREAGAKVITVDMQFTQPTDEADDQALAEAIERAHGKIVLAATDIGEGGETTVLGGNKVLMELGARPASAVLTLDSDGEVRRLPFAKNGLHSLPVVTTEVATGHRLTASRFEDGNLPIDFAGPPETISHTSFYDVLTEKPNSRLFANKIVIVGASAAVLQDIHETATTNGVPMSGPEVWANATSTLLSGVPLRHVPGWLDLMVIVVLGTIAPLGSLGLGPLRAFLDAIAAAILFTVATQVAFEKGWIVDFVYPMFALSVGTLATLAVLYLSEAIERERVHDLFARFVPADVVEQVVARTDDNLRLGAVECDCTVLFSDLRGFTSFSESQPAHRVIEVINCYLNEMTEAILAAGGTLISYMGDGIMAVFGAPIPQADHASRALAAATEMIGPRLDGFNAWLAENGHEHTFAMGVGVNSGSVMAGNIGSEQRVEYTALGDTTNTASRLEGMTKGSGHMLFIAASTYERMEKPPPGLVLVGELEIRGRVAPVPVWTLAPEKPDLMPVSFPPAATEDQTDSGS